MRIWCSGSSTRMKSDRGNSARTRNARLIAIRAFFRYVEYQVPACLDQALRIRALPQKRTDAALIDHLTRGIQALLAAPIRARRAARAIVRCCI